MTNSTRTRRPARKATATDAPSRTPYDVVTDRIIAALEAGTVPWRRPWTVAPGALGAMPRNLVSKRAYRGVNVLVLGLSGFASPYWMTFNQAKALGGHVRKGEKATPVVFWKPLPARTNETTGEVEKAPTLLLRYYSVFNLQQVEGIDPKHLPAVATVPAEEEEPAVEETFAAADAAVAHYLSTNSVTVSHGADRACYSVPGDHVSMPQRASFDSPAEYYSTLFHELAHSTGHPTRLKRFSDDLRTAPFGSPDYSEEELVAEITAAFCCTVTGVEQPESFANSAAYIAGWLKKLSDDRKLVVVAAARAQRAADLILGAVASTVESEDEASTDEGAAA